MGFICKCMNILAYSCGYSCILLSTPDDLKQVSNTVAGVDLSDHVIQVVFTLFDENSRCTENVTVLCIMYTVILQLYVSDSLIPRPSHHPVFECLQYAKTDGGGRLGPLYRLKKNIIMIWHRPPVYLPSDDITTRDNLPGLTPLWLSIWRTAGSESLWTRLALGHA